MKIFINNEQVDFKDGYVLKDLGNGYLQKISFHSGITEGKLKQYAAIYTNGNRYSIKSAGKFTDKDLIK